MTETEKTQDQETTPMFCANCHHWLTPTCVKCHKHDGFKPGDEWLCHDCCGEFYDPCLLAQKVLNDLDDDGRLVMLRLAAHLPGNEPFAAMIYEFDEGDVDYACVSLHINDVMGIRGCTWDEAKALLKEHADSIAKGMIGFAADVIRDL